MRYFIELAFKGTNFNGWQIQPNAITVQEVLDDRLSKLLRHTISTIGCGRTDTGVHATQFFAHFDLPVPINDISNTIYKLNRMLPTDIRILNLFAVDDSAHARFDAINRTYRYFIDLDKNPFSQEFSTYIHFTPNLEIMNEAARMLLTNYDFASFCKTGGNQKTTICKVTVAEWTQLSSTQIMFEITSDRFLRNMVRAIVGTLLDVGRKKLTLDQFYTIIKASNRCVAGQSVPPNGLYLYSVQYPFYQKNRTFYPATFC
ncbi:MAG TPA: tRNA pseudouridine(38-40) synthase TruA [Salinivirgaceae bacterium]|nr:tRNA pseudouridine(38-40) synthase TruA [Salinivirgaceae bacterium]